MAAATMSLSSMNVALPQCEGLARQGLPLIPARRSKSIAPSSRSRVVMSARKGDRDQDAGVGNTVAQMTALALVASAVLPEFAEAAITPSLKNLLLSVAAGFGVLGALVVAVLGVATFDPVKRS